MEKCELTLENYPIEFSKTLEFLREKYGYDNVVVTYCPEKI